LLNERKEDLIRDLRDFLALPPASGTNCHEFQLAAQNPVYTSLRSPGGSMPKYLLKASYTAEGVRGVMKEGGSKREAAARALVKSLGGKVESFYFCHGEADAIVICDFPDVASALAGVMAVNASGVVVASTTPLISAADVDAAAKKTGKYRAPGQ
jgi:uncharacterized protein with GYD domain